MNERNVTIKKKGYLNNHGGHKLMNGERKTHLVLGKLAISLNHNKLLRVCMKKL